MNSRVVVIVIVVLALGAGAVYWSMGGMGSNEVEVETTVEERQQADAMQQMIEGQMQNQIPTAPPAQQGQ